jgi:hypothetical protein
MTKKLSSRTDDALAVYEAERAAKLKAQLSLVEERSKPLNGRLPKKIDTLKVKVALDTRGYSTVSFILRLEGSEFIAEHDTTWYVSKSLDALKARMEIVANTAVALVWTRYIRISYEAVIPYRGHSGMHGTTTRGLNRKHEDEDGEDSRPILGINLTWHVEEYTNPFRLPGDTADRILKRDVDDDDGTAASHNQAVREMPPVGLVLFSEERLEVLKQIRAGITALDDRLYALFGGDTTKVAKQLDKIQDGSRLLGAGK